MNFYGQYKFESCKLTLSTLENNLIMYSDLDNINKISFIDSTCNCAVVSYESILIKGNSVVFCF